MNKRLIAALAAILLAIAGVITLLNYASGAEDRAFEGAQLVDVLQVTAPIAADTNAADLAGKVKSVKLPRTAIAKGAVKSLSDVTGLVTTVELEPGEQLLLARFAERGKESPAKAKSAVPAGMQELTIPVDVARALGGALKVGDTVGIVASYQSKEGDGITKIVQNRVLVLRLSNGGPVTDGQTGGTQLVTFAVRTRDAGKIVNAIEFGKIYLTRQNKDTLMGNGGSISRNDVTQ
jgi:pilus assembly protein CpaB